MENATLEQRVERIEKVIDQIITFAKENPMGRQILVMLGL